MRELTTDERDCLTRLEAWDAKIEYILGLYDQHGRVPRDAAAELYTALKRDIEAEYRDCQNSRRRPPLTKAEEVWYTRTIHQACVRLQARTNASPTHRKRSISRARR